jgi:AraC-like DNA-binding protein
MTSLQPVRERAKGVVQPQAAAQRFRLGRYLPEPPLDALLDHYWLVEWDLTGQPPYVQRTLPYPCVNVVFDTARSGCWGVVRRSFDYTLSGRGKVLGLRFRPGAFRALLGRPVRTISDRVLDLHEIFGDAWRDAPARVLAQESDAAMVAAANTLLQPFAGSADPQVERLNGWLKQAAEDQSITRAEQLAELAGMPLRTLQALFGDYVGVTPKWTIRRYRLHEAADRLASGAAPDLAELAQALGYYDQAHLTRDFKALVGKSPAEYRAAAG